MHRRNRFAVVSAAVLMFAGGAPVSAQTYSCGTDGTEYALAAGPVGSEAYENALEQYRAYCSEYGGGGGGNYGGGGGSGGGGGGIGLGDLCTQYQCVSPK